MSKTLADRSRKNTLEARVAEGAPVPVRTIELHYNVRVAQGHRFCKDVLRPWPEGATLGDVMSELVTELESLGCSDICVTRANSAARHMLASRESE
jgi:hypothetical protein